MAAKAKPVKKAKASATKPPIARPEPWLVHFFQRHEDDDPDKTVPAQVFLDECPGKVSATMVAVLRAVAEAPPPAFSGGGKWEAMHDEMSGYYEVRVDGAQRKHYRLFCLLERDGARLGLGGPSIVLIDGREKPFLTELRKEDYAAVKKLGDEYRRRTPRSVLR
ncbi:MAG: hypothetical protein JNL21_38725 [Myxococcales bacterium]|nr:hypothetical protein [Myxococcales bacterium]